MINKIQHIITASILSLLSLAAYSQQGSLKSTLDQPLVSPAVTNPQQSTLQPAALIDVAERYRYALIAELSSG